MMKKAMKKILCGALCLTACLGSALSFSACETSKPEVEMEIEFNGNTYTLEYTLYRKIAPATVNHFIALAENGYYNGLCVHNYTSNKMYTGAYKYENDNLVYQKYYDIVKGYENFPASVWTDTSKSETTYTLYGEFYSNADFTVENGAMRQTYGALTMFYTDKNTEDQIVIERHNGAGTAWRDYKYNSATSQFFITLDENQSANDDYCTFAELDEDSYEVLDALKEAISDYIGDNFELTSEFTEETELIIDEDDPFVGDQDKKVKYKVPKKAIVIKKVSVTKY